MLGVSMITRGLAARAALTVSGVAEAGAPGGVAAAGAPGGEAVALGVAFGCASLTGGGVLACICAWCSR